MVEVKQEGTPPRTDNVPVLSRLGMPVLTAEKWGSSRTGG